MTAPIALLTLAQAHALIAARIPSARRVGDGSTPLARVHTDTRTLARGDLFVALKGERFDANAMLPQAFAGGAVAALAHPGFLAAGQAGIEVPDTLKALGALAAGWRAQFALPLIAVTGSNGKTTVTQMVASILRAHAGAAAHATAGNLNNEIGVPLTLLGLREHHTCAVVELGMNHPGEIAYLADLAQPTVAIVNNAQREHQEFMHTVEAVARENGCVIGALPAEGVAVFPAHDAHSAIWRALAQARPTLTFALDGEAEVTASRIAWQGDAWQVTAHTPQGHTPLTLHLAGRHNVANALASLAASLAAGVPLATAAAGLAAFRPVQGRSAASRIALAGRSVTLVDDTYNANPDSVAAAIDVLAALPGPRLLVLGDMGEVGDQGPAFHAEAGRRARAQGIEHFVAVGTLCQHAAHAFGEQAIYSNSSQPPVNIEKLAIDSGANSILIKGSRFMRMERMVQALQAAASANPPPATGAAC